MGRKRQTILILEPYRSLAELYTEICSNRGTEVILATRLGEAVDVVSDIKPTAVLTTTNYRA